MHEERRRHQRVAATFDVVWKDATGKQKTRTSDLSSGGCYIDELAAIRVGESIQVKLRLPAGEWMHLTAEVVYNNDLSGFGLNFIEVSDFVRKRLEWLIKAEIHRREKECCEAAIDFQHAHI